MLKNFSFVLLGFLLGGATVRGLYVRSAPSTGPESVASEVAASPSPQVGIPAADAVSQETVGDSATRFGEAGLKEIAALTSGSADAGAAEGGNRLILRDASSSSQLERGEELQIAEEVGITAKPVLPDIYSGLVTAHSPRGLRPDELHARFAAEGRDEAWAYPMELGMNQHIAGKTGSVGTVIESIECRTRYCEIGGYVQSGYTNQSRELIASMSETGWWQLSPNISSTTATLDGVERFVLIISRHMEDGFD